MREAGTRNWIVAALGGIVLLAGCSPFVQQRRRYESLSQKPLSKWTADDVVQITQDNISEELPEDEQAKPLDQLTRRFKQISGTDDNPVEARKKFQLADTTFREASVQRSQDGPLATDEDSFLAAAKQYGKAGALWSDSELEQDALFMAGECYFFANHYPQANATYETLLEQYPETKHLDRVEARRFTISQYWLALSNRQTQPFYAVNWTDPTRPMRDSFGHAVKIYDRIRFDDPTGRLADDATLAAGLAYLSRDDYHRADQYFTDLRTHFASSEHQYHAHLYGIQAKLKTYEGPDYSATPLIEAEKLLKQIHKQFPQLAQRERDSLSRAYAEVRFKLAERDWRAGQYYDLRSQFRSARLLYQKLLDDYPGTEFAQQAQERLTQLVDQPDAPPQRLPWLVKIFPEDKTVRPLIATSPLENARR